MLDSISLDFHCHSNYSRDALLRLETILSICQKKGIDRVVITDHNTIEGARRAQQLDPKRVIVGEEIKTTRGEILAAFVKEEVPRDLPPLVAIKRLREQGAFICLSHPFDPFRENWMYPELEEILPYLDAIEVHNARCLWAGANRRAQDFARKHGLSGVVGSDAHTAPELGRALLIVPPFEGPQGLREVISQAQIQIKRSPFGAHIASRYATLRKKIGV